MLFRSSLTIEIAEGKSLCVVIEDEKRNLIFSLLENSGKRVKRRTIFEVSMDDARKLAMFIVGLQDTYRG